MPILVTGGAGYIGSHTAKMLAAAGHQRGTSSVAGNALFRRHPGLQFLEPVLYQNHF